MNDKPLIQLESLTKSFTTEAGIISAIKDVNLTINAGDYLSIAGPSGCGKSTLLRSFNRMHDLYPGNRYEGEIVMQPDNTNILDPNVDPIEVRMRISMVFQKPNPFPKSIYDNIIYLSNV